MEQISEEEWRERLSPEVYAICRLSGTEPPFSGEHWDRKDEGIYSCAACGQPLFHSRGKYDSGTGWPSFFEVIDPELLRVEEDVRCRNCDSHLGHLFADGPPPTGQRYCINSLALTFEEAV